MKPYPKKKDTPSRKTRKSERNKVFIANRHLKKKYILRNQKD